MRTTLTLDYGIAQQLAELARHTRKPLQQVVNEALRRGLSAHGNLGPLEAEFHLKPHAGTVRPGIDERRFNQLAWEMDEKPQSVIPI